MFIRHIIEIRNPYRYIYIVGGPQWKYVLNLFSVILGVFIRVFIRHRSRHRHRHYMYVSLYCIVYTFTCIFFTQVNQIKYMT